MAKRKKKAAKKTTADKARTKLARGAGKAKAVKKNKASAKKATKKAPKKTGKKAQRKTPKTASKRKKAAKPSATKQAGIAAKPPLPVKRDVPKTVKKTAGEVSKTARSIELISAPPAVARAPEKKPVRKRAEKKAAEPLSVTELVHEEVHETVIQVPIEPQAKTNTNTFYITTAIAYPNGIPHIGHAYEAIATDALARFQRLDGKDVFFLTGTDEHGLKMIQTAQSEGMTPAELAARNAARFKDMDEQLERLVRPLHPDLGACTSPFRSGDLESHAAGRRHLHRHLRGLVFGP